MADICLEFLFISCFSFLLKSPKTYTHIPSMHFLNILMAVAFSTAFTNALPQGLNDFDGSGGMPTGTDSSNGSEDSGNNKVAIDPSTLSNSGNWNIRWQGRV